MSEMRGQNWEQVVATAEEMLSGCLNLVVGCRKMRQLVTQLNASQRDILGPIIGFESETDDYPVGESRKQYSQDYLERADRSLAEYVAEAGPVVLATCQRIVTDFGDPGGDPGHSW